jgi:hypothetical protein
MKKAVLFAAGAMLLLSIPSGAFGQANFDAGRSYAGPTIGLAFLGSAPQFGLNYEYAMRMDFGMVGIGGVFRYWSYSEGYYYGNWKYSNILFGVQGNYHFKVDPSTKFDPWAGLVLGYDGSSVTWDGPGGYFYSTPSSGGLVVNLQGGTRYYVSPTVALRASIGYGSLSYGALDVGVDFKF